ncbi:MAG: hypothetical protein J5845_01785 [Lachnospiraceae bacterium]|nr:hypothetical protein [Lachnospiraceae bacterium]
MAAKRTPKRSSAVSKLNVGTVVFIAFTLYIIVNIILYFNHSHLSIYEVQMLPLASDTKAEAVIIRNETPIKTGIAGYVNYYMRSGTRVSKGETVYSIDESRQIYNMISGNDESYTLSDEDIEQIKNCIYNYNEHYDKSDFSLVYSLKDELTTTVNSISDTYLMEHLNEILIDQSYAGSLTVHKAEASGLVSYFSDSLDGLDADHVTLETFNKKNYTSVNLFDASLKEQGSTIYKLLSDETWSIVLNLTEKQYEALSDKTTITYTIEDDDLTLTSPVIFMHIGDGYFARITLKQYMVRYLNKRFLTVNLDLVQEDGLKIPKSALVEKEFYMVPKSYFTKGGDSNKTGIMILRHDEEEKKKYYEFLPVEIYYEDDTYNYIDMKAITYGTFIYDDKTQDMFQISLVGKLTGVYCVNKGFAQFRRVELMQIGKEFVIVKNGMSFSIAEHDHIAKDSSTIDEAQTIY